MRNLVTSMYDQIEAMKKQQTPNGCNDQSFQTCDGYSACKLNTSHIMDKENGDTLAQATTQKWIRQLKGQLSRSEVTNKKFQAEFKRMQAVIEEKEFEITRLNHSNQMLKTESQKVIQSLRNQLQTAIRKQDQSQFEYKRL